MEPNHALFSDLKLGGCEGEPLEGESLVLVGVGGQLEEGRLDLGLGRLELERNARVRGCKRGKRKRRRSVNKLKRQLTGGKATCARSQGLSDLKSFDKHSHWPFLKKSACQVSEMRT